MNITKWFFSVLVFAILVFNIECCNSKSESSETRAKIASTTTQKIEPMTTTEDLTETTTTFVTEFDYETTTNEANDNGDSVIIPPANSTNLTTKCSGNNLKLNCFNGGTCIRFQMPNEVFLLSCECAEGYIGERCESQAKASEINKTVFNSGPRPLEHDSNSSTTLQVPFALLLVIISFICLQMLSI